MKNDGILEYVEIQNDLFDKEICTSTMPNELKLCFLNKIKKKDMSSFNYHGSEDYNDHEYYKNKIINRNDGDDKDDDYQIRNNIIDEDEV